MSCLEGIADRSRFKSQTSVLAPIFALLTVIAALLLVPSGIAYADESGTCGDNLTWTLTDDGVMTISGTGNMTSYYQYNAGIIGRFNEEKRVKKVIVSGSVASIGSYAFSGYMSLASIDIPGSVTSIGEGAFSGCTSLASVALGEGVASIGSSAFSGCASLESIGIPGSVTSIGSSAFSGCTTLISAVFGEGVTSIGGYPYSYSNDYIFSGCTSLASVIVPASVSSVSRNAFSGCNSLSSGSFGSVQWSLDDGVLTVSGKGKLPYYAHYVWGEVEEKFESAFIGKEVTPIGDDSFDGCTSLSSGSFGDIQWSVEDGMLTVSGEGALPAYASRVWRAVKGNFERLSLGESITGIGSSFSGCGSLASVSLPSSITSIDDSAFSGCTSLASIDIPGSVTSIGDYAFSGCTSLTSVDVPGSVVSIGYGAFRSCTSLVAVVVEEGVISIGEYPSYGLVSYDGVFSGCTSLTSVIVPTSVTSVSRGAFDGCTSLCSGSLGSIQWSLDDGALTVSGEGVLPAYSSFVWGAVKDQFETISLSEGITSIGGGLPGMSGVDYTAVGAFCNCKSLTSVNIPSTVTSIEPDAFRNCTSLVSVDISAPVDDSESAVYIGAYAFYECSSLSSIDVGKGVSVFGYASFWGCESLESIKVSGSIGYIGEAFTDCDKLASISVLGSIDTITHYAMGDCASLTSINILGSIGEIGVCNFDCPLLSSGMFGGVQWQLDGGVLVLSGEGALPDYADTIWSGVKGRIESVVIGEGITSFGDAFSGCSSLASVFIPSSVGSVGAFKGCESLSSGSFGDIQWSLDGGVLTVFGEGSLPAYAGRVWSAVEGSFERVSLCEGITSIGRLFSGYGSLVSVSLPSSVTSIDGYSFSGCTSLASIDIPGSVTSIGSSAFSGCTSLASVALGEGVTSIDGYAFSGCTSLASIDIPESITSFGYGFSDLTSLTSVYIHSYDTYVRLKGSWNTSTLADKVVLQSYAEPDSKLSYKWVPCGNEACIMGVEGGKAFRLTIPSEIEGRPVRAIGGFENGTVRELTLPEGLERICNEAFKGCGSLSKVVLPASVSSIGESAFSGCKSLGSVAIPEPVMVVSDCAFYNCESLTSVEIPDSVASIGESAFRGCKSLASVRIPAAVTSIPKECFEYCSSLLSLDIPDSVVSIGVYAFNGCSSLASVRMPASLETVDKRAFQSCYRLGSVDLPTSVTAVREGAFSGCSSLESAVVRGSEVEFGPSCFSGLAEGSVVYVASDIDYDDLEGNSNYITPERTTVKMIEGSARLLTRARIEVGDAGAYTGSPKEPGVTVTYEGAVLSMGRDYKLTYSGNVSAGIGRVKAEGIGAYAGTATAVFPIARADIADVEVQCPASCEYTGQAIEPVVKLTFNGRILSRGGDYNLSYSDNVGLGTGKASIEGLGNFSGKRVVVFDIVEKLPIETHTVTFESERGQIPESQVVESGGKASKPIDPVSEGYAFEGWELDGSAFDFGTPIEGDVTLVARWSKLDTRVDISSATVALSPAKFTYDGKAKEPEVTVTLGSKTLSRGTDYAVRYANNTDAGRASVTVEGVGAYKGTASATFTIEAASKPSEPSSGSPASSKPATGQPAASGSGGSTGGSGNAGGSGGTGGSSGGGLQAGVASGLNGGATSAGNGADAASAAGGLQQSLKVKTKKCTVSFAEVQSKAQKVKAIKSAKGAVGKVTYKAVKKGSSKYLKISKSGKVTVKKGAPKGTHKLKVKVTAAAANGYAKATKTVTVKVKVK